ncbi:MAG TPA: fused MFS/spermidine synthase [Longimicrobiales bacterium]|nr:fused MFS/spermidine synthase [Longimicrobiales bacterium]
MSAPGRGARAGLFVLAFGSGFATLVIEIAGARLIAPVYGLSAVPWTAVIGVILTALAVGSWAGGRLADRGAPPLAALLALAGLTAALPLAGGALPWAARDALGFVAGALASALVLFAPSVLCLGAVVPYLVRADTESLGAVGRRAGEVSAAATAGAIAGTFATGFVLLPLLPLPLLLAVTGVGLLALAALAARLLGGGARPRDLALAALLLTGAGAAAAGAPDGALHAEQTLYASVVVREREQDGRVVRELLQNGGSSSAEYVDTGASAHAYVGASLRALAPALEGARSALVLGGGALTLPVALVERHPGLDVHVVELDPAVTELARRYFAYGRAPRPRIHVEHGDARVWLREAEGLYDVVYLDVFDHLVTVPWTLVTVEALEAVAGHLRPGGLFAANVLSPLEGPGVAFLERFLSTLEEVFPETRVLRAQPRLARDVTQNLVVLAGPAGALPDGGLPRAAVRAAGPPLTDARAPVEYLQARVFLAGLGWS